MCTNRVWLDPLTLCLQVLQSSKEPVPQRRAVVLVRTLDLPLPSQSPTNWDTGTPPLNAAAYFCFLCMCECHKCNLYHFHYLQNIFSSFLSSFLPVCEPDYHFIMAPTFAHSRNPHIWSHCRLRSEPSAG